MRSAFIAVVAACLCTTALAEVPPLDEAGFTAYVAQRLLAEAPSTQVTITGPLTLRFGKTQSMQEGQANLDRVHRFCTDNPEACENEVTTFIAGVVQVVQGAKVPPTREAVRVVVRTSRYMTEVQSTLPAGASPFQPLPLVKGLLVMPVLDTPKTITMLTEADTTSLGMTADEAVQLGLANLRKTLKPMLEGRDIAAPSEVGQLVGDAYESSRLALFDTWAPIAKAENGKLIVAAPSTDMLLYIGDDSANAVKALRVLVKNVMGRAPNPLSNLVLRWTPTGWEVVP
jgi:hypothetical protein